MSSIKQGNATIKNIACLKTKNIEISLFVFVFRLIEDKIEFHKAKYMYTI